MVIGPDGAFPTGGNDLFADALGRVRVRFPWEPPNESGDPLAKEIFDDPQRSAWLRVSEGWADHGWGMQFLPRIGQEVLVDFIDGNPERPVIVGRLYNAESGSGNSDPAVPQPARAVDHLRHADQVAEHSQPAMADERHTHILHAETAGR